MIIGVEKGVKDAIAQDRNVHPHVAIGLEWQTYYPLIDCFQIARPIIAACLPSPAEPTRGQSLNRILYFLWLADV